MGPDATKTDDENLSTLLSSLGLCYPVSEPQINAYCGLFASGIGFVSLSQILYCSITSHFALGLN